MIGAITLESRDGEHQAPPAAGKVELGYLFLPQVWGRGYAAEACAAVLDWFSGVLPGEPVVLTTQTANVRSVRIGSGGQVTLPRSAMRADYWGPGGGCQWREAVSGVADRPGGRHG